MVFNQFKKNLRVIIIILIILIGLTLIILHFHIFDNKNIKGNNNNNVHQATTTENNNDFQILTIKDVDRIFFNDLFSRYELLLRNNFHIDENVNCNDLANLIYLSILPSRFNPEYIHKFSSILFSGRNVDDLNAIIISKFQTDFFPSEPAIFDLNYLKEISKNIFGKKPKLLCSPEKGVVKYDEDLEVFYISYAGGHHYGLGPKPNFYLKKIKHLGNQIYELEVDKYEIDCDPSNLDLSFMDKSDSELEDICSSASLFITEGDDDINKFKDNPFVSYKSSHVIKLKKEINEKESVPKYYFISNKIMN